MSHTTISPKPPPTMAATFSSFSISSRSLGAAALMLLLALSIANLAVTDAAVGVCYGMMGNNLPNHWDVVGMYKERNIRRMRLYDPNHGALQALKNSGIEVMLGVPNGDLQRLSNQGDANWWVQKNVLDFWPSVRFRYIAVGNEVDPVGGSAKFVLPAIVSVFNAIRAAGLQDQIKVSTAIDTTLIGVSYPPSAGAFRNDVKPYLEPIFGHLQYAKTPLLANIYTYFSYMLNPGVISLPYALFDSPNVVVWDNGKGYQNLFDAMLDSLYSAMERTGAGGSLDIVVSETGWPSEGANGASFDNARIYLSNFIQHVNKGTPKRPRPFEAYLFAMFNENQKTPELEKNFGMFFANKQPKYNLNFGGSRNDISTIESANETVALRSDM